MKNEKYYIIYICINICINICMIYMYIERNGGISPDKALGQLAMEETDSAE